VGGHIVTTCRQIEQDKLLFAVNDSGIGIRPEDQALIFEEFRQVDGSLTREVPGTGLGLTISKRIVEMHGGQIWVESALHEGATFFVMLPCSCPPKPPGSHQF
jgi:signal transduction histidine kinase